MTYDIYDTIYMRIYDKIYDIFNFITNLMHLFKNYNN